jgi:hypothetical protein
MGNLLNSMAEYSSVARFEVFMALMIEFMVFWVVAPCSVVVGCQRFQGSFCHHFHG